MTSTSRVVRVLLASAFLAGAAPVLSAQICLGGPKTTSLAYVNGKGTGMTSNGGIVTFHPGNVALSLGGAAVDAGSNESGFNGSFRFAYAIGGKLQVCPTLGLGFSRLKWDVDANASVTTNQLVGRGGVSIGYDIVINGDFDIAPFVAGEYAERVRYFQTQVTNSATSNSATTHGAAEASYGVMVRYTHIFVAYSGSHAFEKAPPSDRRLIVGFAF